MRTIIIPLLFPIACLANEAAPVVDAECEGAVPHGSYVVKSAAGAVRIEGRYADGLRAGDFRFFGPGGDRLVLLPYTKGLIDGTVKVWHTPGTGEIKLKLESELSAGFVDGRHRTWYENGNPRSDFSVEEGEIVSGRTWNPDGSELEINSAAAFLQFEIESDFAYFSRLEQVMDAYPPEC